MTNAIINPSDFHSEEDFKDVRSSDRIIPKAVFMQSTHQLVKDQVAKFACLFDTVNKKEIKPCGSSIGIIPLMYWNEWIEWNPKRDDKNKIISRSLDPLSQIAKEAMAWKKIMTPKGEKLKVTEYYHYICLCPEYYGNYTEVILVSFSKTAHKVGKELLNRLMNFKIDDGTGKKVIAPVCITEWELSVKKEASPDGEYAMPVIGNGKVIPPEHWDDARLVKHKFLAEKEAFKSANAVSEKDEAEAQAADDKSPF